MSPYVGRVFCVCTFIETKHLPSPAKIAVFYQQSGLHLKSSGVCDSLKEKRWPRVKGCLTVPRSVQLLGIAACKPQVPLQKTSFLDTTVEIYNHQGAVTQTRFVSFRSECGCAQFNAESPLLRAFPLPTPY